MAKTVILYVVLAFFSIQFVLAQEEEQTGTTTSDEITKIETTPEIAAVVVAAFRETHDGFSSDEVILQDDLQSKFIQSCLSKMPDVSVETFNWTLLGLRKQGKLSEIETTKQKRDDLEGVRHVGEIVARSLQDSTKISIDRVMCNPESRKSFDDLSRQIDRDIDLYLVRKAAFQLRKARQLKPELITRIADWGRVVTVYDAADLVKHLDKIPEVPGIYIFSDRDGYLYIGESDNLRRRLTSHLDDSDRKSLANYLKGKGMEGVKVEVHTFDANSRINELSVRRAYESELIRSRNPRLNVRP